MGRVTFSLQLCKTRRFSLLVEAVAIASTHFPRGMVRLSCWELGYMARCFSYPKAVFHSTTNRLSGGFNVEQLR